jgi:uncharacterized repeat protein (TIGR01451 family)
VYSDAFITWIDPDPGGTAMDNLLYSTFLGGSDFEYGIGWGDIQLVGSGEVIVGGSTRSIDSFPTTAEAYARQLNGESFDAFAVRMRLQGNGADDLVYGTYFGGTNIDHAAGVAVGPNNTIWIGGETWSGDLPVSTDALYPDHNGGSEFYEDGFLTRLATIAAPDLSASTKQVSPQTAGNGEVVTYTVNLVNSGNLTTTVQLQDNLPETLLLVGAPEASTGTPIVNGTQISWQGEMLPAATVWITYTAQINAVGDESPAIANRAIIDDGAGSIYIRQTFLNAFQVFEPWVNK